MKAYGSTENLRNFAYQLRKGKIPFPLVMEGTVKLHGTNAGIGLYVGQEGIKYQSRNNFIGPGKDNSNFYHEMSKKDLSVIFDKLPKDFKDHLVVFGEWCGAGINTGTAIQKITQKFFVIFAVLLDDKFLNLKDYKHLEDPSQRIFNIKNFKTYSITLNSLEDLEAFDAKATEQMLEVEKECPVALAIAGISGVGEGIVYEAFLEDGERVIFKAKGDEHKAHEKASQKAKALVTQDTIDRVTDFVCPTWRMEQIKTEVYQLNNGGTIVPEKFKDFLNALKQDIQKEESRYLEENNVAMRDLSQEIYKRASTFIAINT